MESRHGTLSAGTVATVTFTTNHSVVEVINRDGAADIFFVVDSSATPTVGGNNTWVLPATKCSLEVTAPSEGGTTVKLISSGTPTYSVIAR